MSESQIRVCIIGAGVSGLVAIKSCLEDGLVPVCLERSHDIGGLWRFTETVDGKACVMRSTVINTSKEMMAYSDYPPPKEFANFMHNTKIMEYMRGYTKHFELEPHINYHCEVESVKQSCDYETTGKWDVTYERVQSSNQCTTLDGNVGVHTETFDGVFVCSGHHAQPNKITLPGMSNFPGLILHSHDVRDAMESTFRDKKVIVVGIGNSGVDLAVEISRVCKEIFLSTRRGTWLLSRFAPNGIPGDMFFNTRLLNSVTKLLGMNIVNSQIEKICNSRIDHKLYGLQPEHRPLQAHATLNDDLQNRLGSGAVKMKHNVKRFFSANNNDSVMTSVEFEDGSVEHDIDVVILATGYIFSFPFLDSQLSLNVNKNRLPLYKFVYPTKLPRGTLAFIGYIQPWGAIQPLSEMQCRWAVRVIKGLNKLPSSEQMENYFNKTIKEMDERYVASTRHTMQVDWIPYMDLLAEEVGCKPKFNLINFLRDPYLMWRLVVGPCLPYQFRLTGPHTWPQARNVILTCQERMEAPLRTREICQKSGKKSKTLSLIFPSLVLLLLAYLWMYKS